LVAPEGVGYGLHFISTLDRNVQNAQEPITRLECELTYAHLLSLGEGQKKKIAGAGGEIA